MKQPFAWRSEFIKDREQPFCALVAKIQDDAKSDIALNIEPVAREICHIGFADGISASQAAKIMRKRFGIK